MWKRFGPGPVFAYESLLNARRWQVYAGRSVFVLVILAGMTIVWMTRDHLGPMPAARLSTNQQMAKLGEWFFYTMAGIQISLVILAAPAAAAGSICMDKARGTLMHIFVTDLSNAEIVLGKLAARIAPVAGLIACGVPVACLSALLGGIEFESIAGLFVVTFSLAVVGCTLALTISLWAGKPHEVLMAVYMILGLWLISLPIWISLATSGKIMAPPAWFGKANPYVLVFARYTKPGFAGAHDVSAFAGFSLAFSAALAILSIVKIRKVVIAQSGCVQKESRRLLAALKRLFPSWPSPQLDGNPVVWREWSRNRPSRLARWLWATLFLVVWASMAWGTYESVNKGTGPTSSGFGFGMVILVSFGLLMLSATAPTALVEERVRGSLDALLATPLSTKSILVGKWCGMYQRVLWLALVPLYAVVFIAATVPDIPIWAFASRFTERAVPLNKWDRVIAAVLCPADFLVSGAFIVSWGLLLATWVPRLGRAVAFSVIAFFLLGFCWPMVVEMVFPMFGTRTADWYERTRVLRMGLTSLSPIGGPMNLIEELEQFESHGRGRMWLCMGTVVLIKAAIAGFLFWLSLMSFNRCLGRMPEAGARPRSRKVAVREDLVASAVS